MPDRFRNTAQPDRDWWEALWEDPARVVERLGVSTGDRVADVCAGDGLFTLALAERTDEAVYAVDLDIDHLSTLEGSAEGAGLSVETVEADARELDDALPEPVEFVLLANTFHGVADPTAFARTVATTLTDDGRFAVINWRDQPRAETSVLGERRGPPTDRRMPAGETIDAVSDAGFELDAVIDLPPYHYGAIFCPAP